MDNKLKKPLDYAYEVRNESFRNELLSILVIKLDLIKIILINLVRTFAISRVLYD
jgi:hypothetical protein